MADIKFEIVKKIATINDKSVWHKELNLVSWNDKEPKYDIRDWDAEHQKMSKGITLTKDEMLKLKLALNDLDLGDSENASECQVNDAANVDVQSKNVNDFYDTNTDNLDTTANANDINLSSIDDIFASN